LRKFFPIQKGFSRRVVAEVRAVDDVSFEVREGETLGLVGDGCGRRRPPGASFSDGPVERADPLPPRQAGGRPRPALAEAAPAAPARMQMVFRIRSARSTRG
jgi:hypothetical protein